MSLKSLEQRRLGSFPSFPDGNVVLRLSGEHIYQLHASSLRSQSPVFANLLCSTHGNSQITTTQHDDNESPICYQLELKGAQSGVGRFVVKGRASASQEAVGNVQGMTGGRVLSNVYKYYDNLFRSMYSLEIDIMSDSLDGVLRNTMGLIHVAEIYGCISPIAKSVDLVLQRHPVSLWKGVRDDPIAWSNLAYRIQSPTIFRESMIHIVGKWKMWSNVELESIQPDVLKLCHRKHEDFEKIKVATQMRMLSHYSPTLHIGANTNIALNGSSGDTYPWIVTSIFRHWFGQHILEKMDYQDADGGYSFFYKLAKGGQYYLTRRQIEGFRQYFPHAPTASTTLENCLDALKNEICDIAAPFLQSELRLGEIYVEKLNYFTSVEIFDDSDYPWEQLTTVDVGPSS